MISDKWFVIGRVLNICTVNYSLYGHLRTDEVRNKNKCSLKWIRKKNNKIKWEEFSNLYLFTLKWFSYYFFLSICFASFCVAYDIHADANRICLWLTTRNAYRTMRFIAPHCLTYLDGKINISKRLECSSFLIMVRYMK